MKLTKAQEERFEKYFRKGRCLAFPNVTPVHQGEDVSPYLKRFIANEISLQLSEIIQIAEGMKDYKYGRPKKAEYIDCDCGYSFDDCVCERNETLNELISILTTLQEGE